tara:strand:- start:272 stop:430 length:159 start_codon:yes stop_codon:yes gene_type:complete
MDTWMYIVGGVGIVIAFGGGGWLYRTALRRGKDSGKIEARIKAEMAKEAASE